MSSSPSPAHATPTPERDPQLLSIGKQCSHPSCLLIDFLPFKCQHCEDSFCQEHFMVNAHSCPKYDASKHNRVAPNCPLCNEPVAIRVGQEPNARMEEHFAKECSVMLGKTVKKSTPTCARAKCGKVLFSPIRCDKCQKQFCPTHRFPSDHSCNSTPAASTSSQQHRPGGIPASSRLLNLNAKTIETKASAAGTAIKKSLTTASTSASASTLKSSTSTSSSHLNLFSKTDRNLLPEITISSNDETPKLTTSSTTTVSPKSPPKSPKLAFAVRPNPFVPRPVFVTA
ncbi:hypothetical protein D9758_002749 [Tetrapyrgos nigripes]|uniref:AN1-type domain-containing protein n=1 Tax=Tetrapyrgos nigripes TaxID=182062 RepID=A0A8H5GQR2_9AGAR|nr:hypothetical protein D9758_002749 [Tetrapyrgos nigripes]